MDAETYEARRNELVGLIEEIFLLGKIPTKTMDSLYAVRKKVFENQFRVVLISDFECGKSTTFNMFCDGQEISPRGAFMRTSATVVSVQNTLDDELIGKASIVWRSDRELISIFSKYLLRYFKELEPERFRQLNQADQLENELHFPVDLPLLKRALSRQLEDFKKIDIVNHEELEIAKITLLISEFYDDPFIEKLKKCNAFRISDIEKMVAFPKNWQREWYHQRKLAFLPEEAIFAFIRQAHCYIRSENLMRTGSVLIDCPGLFASTYDSKIAFEVLENADIVWYILKGKGIGNEDRNALRQIATAKPDGLFLSVNIPADNTEYNVRSHILPSYEVTLRELGIRATASDIHLYNALLGLTALQAERLLHNELDEHTTCAIGRLNRVFGKNTNIPVAEILQEQAENTLHSSFGYSVRDLKKFDLLAEDGNGIELAMRHSGFRELVDAVESETIRKKAQSVLVSNGTRKAIELIQELEADLKTTEIAAEQSEFEVKQAFDSAQKKLDEFIEFCNLQLNVLQNRQIDIALATNYWKEVILSSIEDVAELAAQRIAPVNCNEFRQELSEQIINDAFADIIRPKATAWIDLIKNGDHELFNAQIGDKMEQIIKNTAREWAVIVSNEPILEGLPVPTPIIGTEIIKSELIDSVVAKAPGVAKDIVVGATTGTAIGAAIGSFIFPVIGTIVGGAIGFIAGTAIGGGIGEDKRKEVIYQGVKQELLDLFATPEQMELVIEKQRKRIETFRLGIIRAFENAFEQPREAFQTRWREVKNLFYAKSQERGRIADENNKFRMQKLEPLRKKLQIFEKKVQEECC